MGDEIMGAQNDEIRIKLRETIEKFYNRLHIPFTSEQLKYLKRIDKIDIIECGHGWFFPIIGMFRLPIMATTLINDDNTIVLFRCNDDYTRRTHYSTRKLSFYQKGLPEDQQNNSITMKCERKRILRYAPPPSEKYLQYLRDRIKTRFYENFPYAEREYQFKIGKKDRKEILENIDWIIDFLTERLNMTDNYADWCERINIDLLRLTNPEQYDKIFFVSHIDLAEIFREQLQAFLNMSEEFVKVINEVIAKQKADGKAVYKANEVDADYLPFWFLCPKCMIRNRAIKIENGFFYKCEQCGNCYNSEKMDFVIPDAITKQTLTALLNLKARVVGGIKPYSAIADACTEKICGINAPPRIVLNARPKFYGIGEPKIGSTRTTVLRALIEIEPETLGRLLVTRWEENPIIKSEFLPI